MKIISQRHREMLCRKFGHKFNGGSCVVCGEKRIDNMIVGCAPQLAELGRRIKGMQNNMETK